MRRRAFLQNGRFRIACVSPMRVWRFSRFTRFTLWQTFIFYYTIFPLSTRVETTAFKICGQESTDIPFPNAHPAKNNDWDAPPDPIKAMHPKCKISILETPVVFCQIQTRFAHLSNRHVSTISLKTLSLLCFLYPALPNDFRM